MLNVIANDAAIADLRLTEKELTVARQRAITNGTRKLRTMARHGARRRTGLKARSVNRRVLAFPRRGKVWLGADPVSISSAPGFKIARPWRHRRLKRGTVRWGRVYVRGKPFSVDGKKIVSQRDRRYSRRSGKFIFERPYQQRRPRGKLEYSYEAEYPIDQALADEYAALRAAAPQVIDQEFRAAAEGIIRRRA